MKRSFTHPVCLICSYHSLTHLTSPYPTPSHPLANDPLHLDDLKKVFKDTGTKFVFTVPDLLPKVKDALADFPAIKVRAVNIRLFFGRHGIVVFSGHIQSNK